MPKTEFLQIRLTPEDRRRIGEVAAAQHLDPSTWARQVLLRALAAAESTQRSSKSNNDVSDTSTSELV